MSEKFKDLENIIDKLGDAEQFSLENLEDGKKLEIKTGNTTYLLERIGDDLFISGHPKYCRVPTKVTNVGSNIEGSTSILMNKIAIGGNLEYTIPNMDWQGPIVTTPIEEFRELD